MTDTNARFEGSIPEVYDRELGPVLFEPYATDLARRIDVQPGQSVLEIACGTGIVTGKLRARMPQRTTLVATDLNEAMIEHARFRLGDMAGIEWRVADAAELPFADRSFGAVVCQFGLMFVPDKEQAAREALRVLAPGGTFVVSVWDRIEHNKFAHVTHEALTAYYPVNPPTFYSVPFSYPDPDVLKRLLETNGFERVTVQNVRFEFRAASARAFATGLIEGNPVRLAIEERGGTLEPVIVAIEHALLKEFGSEPLVSTLQAWVATARRPG
jgi:ubiquinone/menaquinone biosynthesis C-methylase UbiE